MSYLLTQKTIEEFLDELAANSPAPGGGSVAAMGGALSASLLSMVSNLTIGRKKYLQVEDEIRKYLVETQKWQKTMTMCIHEDTNAFKSLMSAYKMTCTSTESKQLKESAVQKALHRTISVPFIVAQGCIALLKLTVLVAEKGNVNAITDAGVAGLMAYAALQGALLNVKINLSSIKDSVMKKELTDSVNQLIEEGEMYRKEAVKIVEKKIG